MRTIKEFTYKEQDLKEKVNKWVEEYGYRLIKSETNKHEYEASMGFVKKRLMILFDSETVRIEAWLFNAPLGRLFLLNLIPIEDSLETKENFLSEFVGVISRTSMRNEVNELLRNIGGELIK